MPRLAIAALAAVLALVGACADPTSPTVAHAPVGPLLAANTAGKVAVCRESGKAGSGKFDVQYVSTSQLGSYSDANGVPLAGHESDYLVTDRTPCPPPATPGELQVCVLGNTNLWLGTSFTYLVNGVPVTITPNECAILTFRVGTHVHVAQTITSGTQLTAIAVGPAGAGTSDLGAATADVVIGTDRATASFTNVAIGTLRVCTAAGPGVTAGTAFDYLTFGRRVSTTADGTCAVIEGVPTGLAHVQQVVPLGVYVASVAGTPYVVSTQDLANGSADIYVAKGQTTTITFTDGASAGASLVLCAAKGPSLAAGTTASFTLRGNTYTLTPGPGACTTLNGLPATGLRVQMTATLTEVAAAIALQPPTVPQFFTSTAQLVSSDLPRGTAVVDLDPLWGAATLTYTIDGR